MSVNIPRLVPMDQPPSRQHTATSTSPKGGGPLRAALAFVRQSGNPQSTPARLQLTILTSLLIQFANVISGIVLARSLGPAGRGILTAAMLFGPLLASIGGLGIADALVYHSGRVGGAKSPALITALCIGTVQSLILVLAGLAIVPALLRAPSHPAASLALAYLTIIPLFPLSQYPLAVLQGRLRIAQFNLVRASVPLVYTVTLVLLWRLGAMTVGAALAASLGSTGVACILALAAAVGFSTHRASFTVARELLGYGLRAHSGNLATILVAQIDLLMLTAMVPSRDLGYYTVATSAAMTASLIPAAASMVLFPTFANQSAEAIPRALARFLLWGMGGALVLTAGLVLVVPWAVVPVYGPAFRAAAPLGLILVPGYAIRGASQMLVAILRGSGTPMSASAGQIVGLVVLAALLPLGITARGTEGAALAVTVSAAAALLWLLITALRRGRLTLRLAVQVWRSDLTRLRHAVR